YANQVKSQLFINEVSCSNLSQFADNHSDYGDWFEIYNAGASAVNLQGYYLSDDSLNNLKWQFPSSINIAANGFMRIWASGRNEIVGNSVHTNFKLTQTKSNKEEVTLSDPSGIIISQVKLTEKTQLGHSYGRTTNGAATWSVFVTPTLASSNNTATSYSRYAMRPDFDIAPGFYNSTQTVSITTTEPVATIRYTTDGTLPTATSTIYTGPVTIASTKVLKAIVFTTTPGVLPSFIQYGTYFINVSHTVPVVSITGTNLTQLANGNGNLEPFGSFEFFDTLKLSKARTYGEFNQHGQDSWANSHRSLDFVSRDEMGYNSAIKEQLFSMSNRDEFQRIILR
ncbi:MAG TPA: lamin tail domain-containing protein, partial [Bacteroidia bacterium]|nr:lamin tail domain-containing protein [Bacteroidia bacterium]